MNKPPKKWKVAILVWIAIYPTITLLFALFGQYFDRIPSLLLRTLATTIIVVPLAVFGIVPMLHKVLHKWMNS